MCRICIFLTGFLQHFYSFAFSFLVFWKQTKGSRDEADVILFWNQNSEFREKSNSFSFMRCTLSSRHWKNKFRKKPSTSFLVSIKGRNYLSKIVYKDEVYSKYYWKDWNYHARGRRVNIRSLFSTLPLICVVTLITFSFPVCKTDGVIIV